MLIVVGGHTRNIGKTSVVAGLIQSLPHRDWTAMKITQFGHGICSASGVECDCCLAADHPFAIAQEGRPGGSDSGRFLAAGARRSYWVRTATGQLANAVPTVREVYAASRNLIVESNSLVEFSDAGSVPGGAGLRPGRFQGIHKARHRPCRRVHRGGQRGRGAVLGKFRRRGVGGQASLPGPAASVRYGRAYGIRRGAAGGAIFRGSVGMHVRIMQLNQGLMQDAVGLADLLL